MRKRILQATLISVTTLFVLSVIAFAIAEQWYNTHGDPALRQQTQGTTPAKR